MTETVWLQRPSGDEPWGFRLQGGRDYQTPLSVQKVTAGSIASTGLSSGDVILKIGETNTSSLTYAQAMDVLKASGNLLQLSIMKQGGQISQSSKVDAESNMASGAVHDLFQDMYRYTDPATYPQEGALSHKTPQSSSYPYAQPTQSYQPSNPSIAKPHTNGQGYGMGSNYPPTAGNYQDKTYDRPSYQYTGPSSGPSFPAQAPPSYSDVQTHRDQMSYPYNPTQSASSNQYPYQPNPSLGNQYTGYPHSVSSSTSELSDISSGIGTSDGKPCGSSPALGRSMTSPGGVAKPYTSGSSVDSSSGVGSYSCETPEQIESVCHTKRDFGRQDSFPPPPPPITQEASTNNQTYTTPESFTDKPSVTESPTIAPPPAPPLPPPPPPPPLPPSNWKAKPNEDKTAQPPTRLEQQLSNMSVGSDYGRQNSFPAPPPPITQGTYQPQSPQTYTPSAPGQSPYYGGQSPAYTPASPSTNQQQSTPPAMPDAVLNMAAKGEPDKKPWAYAPDMDSIKEQRDRVRRRAPAGGMPKYQQLLNLPQFEDSPRQQHTGPTSPPTPPQAPQTPQYGAGPGEATVAHLQYNSPLKMYSEQNVSDAFTGQTDGVVTGVEGLKKDQNPDITQSPVYKMIHGLDNNKQRARPAPPAEAPREKPTKAPANDDELTFSGIHTSADIPSKSFQRLQNMTGGSEIDTSSIRANVTGEEEPIGNYDQASIRYTGRNIPSKSFRMLQSMTGPEPSMQGGPATRRQRRRPEPQIEENPDDIVDISYVGGNIPSRSFKVLQHAVGQPEAPDEAQQTAPINSRASQNDDSNQGQGRTVKVIRLRQQASLDSEPSGVTDF